MEPTTSTATANTTTTITPASATVQASQSSSSETNKKRNNHRRRNNTNKNKARPATEETSTSQTTKQQPKKKEPLKGFKNPKLEDQDDEEADGEVCFICTRPIDYYSVAPCNHRTCHLCTLRLRALYKTKNCAYCKAEATKVIFTNDSEKLYENYKRDDTPFYDKKYGIRFETQEMYKDTMVLLQHNCPEPECEEAFESLSELKRHVKQAHDRLCCDLCLRNKKIFSHEHTLYTNGQLQKHHREGDGSFNKDDETGFTGHPECVFCRTRFYGADELFEHCRDKHEQCHLCVRRGIQHQYYANYDSLEKHFKKEHFLCQYKECLDNKFVVFESDIDLKAHEVKEHGNTLSRQQRAKQSRVEVNLNYSSSQQQQQQRNNSRGRQSNIGLSAEDFPDINGSVNTSALLSSRLASTSLSEQEQWPTLGEDISNSGRSSPAQSSSANESDTGIVSRHAAALDRVADVFKNVEKVIKFRQLTTGFTSLSTDADTYVNSIYELCDKNADLTAKVLTGAKDLVDNRTLRSEMVRIWNHKKEPKAGSGSDTPRVLEINPTSNQNRRLQTKKKPGVWDKVASAAVDAGAIRPSFPPIQSRTPWSGSSTPRTNSESDLQQLFPALPSSAGSMSRRADINAMLKKTNRNAWAETSNDSEYSDTNIDDTSNRKGKKGKKGKQVLFRVGL